MQKKKEGTPGPVSISKLTIGAGLSVAGAVLLGFVALYLLMYSSGYQDGEIANARRQIADLERQVASLEGYEADPEQLSEALLNAVEAGNEVADLQNEYLAITDVESGGDSYDEIHGISEKLISYFSENDGAAAAQWFYPKEADSSISWTFVTPYSASSGGVTGIWLCRAGTDSEIAAFASGVYANGTFSDVQVEMTTYGYELSAQSTTTLPEDTEEDVMSGDAWVSGKSPIDIMEEGGSSE